MSTIVHHAEGTKSEIGALAIKVLVGTTITGGLFFFDLTRPPFH
jgi:hypothetical protein